MLRSQNINLRPKQQEHFFMFNQIMILSFKATSQRKTFDTYCIWCTIHIFYLMSGVKEVLDQRPEIIIYPISSSNPWHICLKQIQYLVTM